LSSVSFEGAKATVELSSLTASSAIRRLGAFFLSKMAVAKSFFSPAAFERSLGLLVGLLEH